MPYNYATFAELVTATAVNLSDPDKVHWTDTELGIYLNAAIREFNAIARMFRDRGTFETNANDLFYDLTTALRNGAGDLILAPTITSANLLEQTKYMLIEPNPSDDTAFTDAFTLTNFNNSLTQRTNQFLLETGLVITQPTAQVVSAGEGRVQIADDTVIDIRRAIWTDVDGNITQLVREDEFSSSAFSPLWPQESGTPQRYSIYPDPLLTLQLIPPPVDNGTLTLQTISSGTVLDDFTPFILWGVLSDMLSSPGPGNEPLRDQYAEQRWSEGIAVGRQVATTMQARINDLTASAQSVYDLDMFRPDWMVAGVPDSIGVLGSNLVSVSPRANGVYSITIDTVRNAPVLVGSSPLPFGREYQNLMIDYASHLALFKHGGQEFQATFSLYDAFVKAALAYNNRMNAQNLNFPTLVDKAHQQEEQQALRTQEVAA